MILSRAFDAQPHIKLGYSVLIGFLCGALSALAMAPFNAWPVLILTLGGLYTLILKSKNKRQAALIGYMFGIGYFGFGLYWIGNALLVEGNPYRWAWPLAVSGMPLMLAPFYALAGACLHPLLMKYNISWGGLIFAVIFTLAEWLRGHMFTGFPWNLMGYTWINFLEIAQIVRLWDIYLLTFLTVLWLGTPAFLLFSASRRSFKIIYASTMIGIFLGTYGYGYFQLQESSLMAQSKLNDYEFILVQPNIPQNEKWDPERIIENFKNNIQQSLNTAQEPPAKLPKATYIIWPETAIGNGVFITPRALSMIADMLRTYPNPAYLITGAQRYIKEGDHYYNSLVIFDNTGKVIQTYDKSHLVPFGEYMPLGEVLDIAPVVGFKGFERGSGVQTLTTPEGLKFSPLICYEVIFANHVINPVDRPDIMINVTNDAWYGDSPGPRQHLIMTRFRAIENDMPLLRVANTGITAHIDRFGRIISSTPIFENATLRVHTIP